MGTNIKKVFDDIKARNKRFKTYKEKFRGKNDSYTDESYFVLTKRSGRRSRTTDDSVTDYARAIPTTEKRAFAGELESASSEKGTIVL
ncbi:MAG: hypothetical protein WA584_05925 [Pyrinomonadaceae bacterium]